MILHTRNLAVPIPVLTIALVTVNLLVAIHTAAVARQPQPPEITRALKEMQDVYEGEARKAHASLEQEMTNRAARGEGRDQLISEATKRFHTALRNLEEDYEARREALTLQLPYVKYLLKWGADPSRFADGMRALRNHDRRGFRDLLWFAWTLVTCQYIHAGYGHCIGNMLFLLLFGSTVELAVRSRWYFFLYSLGGIAAALTQFLIMQNDTSVCVGASGAIAAVMGAYLIAAPESRISLGWVLGPFGFLLGRVSAAVFLFIYMMGQATHGVSALAAGVTGGVAWFAHLGGFAAGCGWMLAREVEAFLKT